MIRTNYNRIPKAVYKKQRLMQHLNFPTIQAFSLHFNLRTMTSGGRSGSNSQETSICRLPTGDRPENYYQKSVNQYTIPPLYIIEDVAVILIIPVNGSGRK
jgi:hypothetical protein